MRRFILCMIAFSTALAARAQPHALQASLSLDSYGTLNHGSTNLRAGITYRHAEMAFYAGTGPGMWTLGGDFKYFGPNLNPSWNPYLKVRVGQAWQQGIVFGSQSITNTFAVSMGIQKFISGRVFLYGDFGFSKLLVRDAQGNLNPGDFERFFKPNHDCNSFGIGYCFLSPNSQDINSPVQQKRGPMFLLGLSYLHNWTSFFSNEPSLYPVAEISLHPKVSLEAGMNLLMNVRSEWVNGDGVALRLGGARIGVQYLPASRKRTRSHTGVRLSWVHYTASYADAGEHVGFDLFHKLRFPVSCRMGVDLGTGLGLRWQVLPNAPGPPNLYYQTWLETGLSYAFGKKDE